MKVSFPFPASDLYVANPVGFPLAEPPAVALVAPDPSADEAGDLSAPADRRDIFVVRRNGRG